MNDLIKREYAIEAVKEILSGNVYWDYVCDAVSALSALPSAEAVSREAIISAKFHPYPFTKITPMDVGMESYKRGWNDALDAVADNAPSAEAVQGWIPFKKRPLTDEEKQEYPDWTYIFDCPLPDDEEEILLSNGKYVWTDTFIDDGECYLDGGDDIDDGMAWMPLPKPYREDGEA